MALLMKVGFMQILTLGVTLHSAEGIATTQDGICVQKCRDRPLVHLELVFTSVTKNRHVDIDKPKAYLLPNTGSIPIRPCLIY